VCLGVLSRHISHALLASVFYINWLLFFGACPIMLALFIYFLGFFFFVWYVWYEADVIPGSDTWHVSHERTVGAQRTGHGRS
jgi:hypothetical protein